MSENPGPGKSGFGVSNRYLASSLPGFDFNCPAPCGKVFGKYYSEGANVGANGEIASVQKNKMWQIVMKKKRPICSEFMFLLQMIPLKPLIVLSLSI